MRTVAWGGSWPFCAWSDSGFRRGSRCEIPGYLLSGNNELKRVDATVKDDQRLTIAVVGTGSSTLAGPDGPRRPIRRGWKRRSSSACPASRQGRNLASEPRQTTDEMAEGMDKLLVDEKPDLVIWQTGTIDAIRRVEPEDFRAALDEGSTHCKKAGPTLS